MSVSSHPESCRCSQHAPTSLTQTLTELDFERGIWSAAVNGDVDRVRKFLQNGLFPDILDSSHHTALHYASRHNHTEVCSLLLSSGANVNAQTLTGHVTALHRAAYCGHCDVIKLLLRHGADISQRDVDGQTAIHKACEGGHIDAIQLLLSADASLQHATDCRQRTPFDCLPASSDHIRTLLYVASPDSPS